MPRRPPTRRKSGPAKKAPGKQAPGKHAAKRPAGKKPAPTLVDPETVAAVGKATAKGAHILVRSLRRTGRALARASSTAARWLGPRIKRASAIGARASGRAAVAGGRWTWAHRKAIGRVGHRVLWWGALAILVWVGQALLGTDGDPRLIAGATLWFATGLTMATVVMLTAPESRMRLASLALAGGHGALGALAWLSSGASLLG